MLKVKRLRCAGMKNPLGIDLQSPVLSWQIASDERGTVQTAYRLLVCEEPEQLAAEDPVCFYDSGRMESDDNLIRFPRLLVKSAARYYWRIQVWDNHGQTAVSEEEAWFETGLLYQKDWQAKWVEPKQHPVVLDHPGEQETPEGNFEDSDEHMKSLMAGQRADESMLFPCPMLRREFEVRAGGIKKARVYATAHGLYRLELNGKRVGNYEFMPECTPYREYLQVQTYDITDQLKEGKNAIGASLADGWWAGRIGNNGWSCEYGDKLALLMQILITYEDGTEEIIGTDERFTSYQGPLRYADLYMGEKYDAHYNREGWSKPGYPSRFWQPVNVADYGYDNLTGQNAAPMKVLEELTDIEVYTSPKGEMMIDCKQAMFGNVSMKIKGAPHAAVTIYYTEETDKDRNFWLEIMGANSAHEDVFVLDESGEGFYDPMFSGTGFRYLKVESNFGEVEVSEIKARLIGSDIEPAMRMSCSDERVNKLQECIKWTLRSNAMSVLTDDPDRERCGWTGDNQMVLPALCYQLDGWAFYKRWLKEMAIEQRDNGTIPNVIPNWKFYDKNDTTILGPSAGWADASVLMPWVIYNRYGDISVLEECYPMMKKWVEYIVTRAATANPPWIEDKDITPERAESLKYLWNADFNFGDWLTPSACYNEETGEYTYFTQTLTYLTGTYFYAYDTQIMSKVAALLGKEEEAKYYGMLHEKVREAAVKEIYHTGGILESEYMGAQIFALHMGLYPENEKQKVFDRLVDLIEEKGMDTGFLSTTIVCDILCENGRADLAYRFLLNDRFPSWLYEVEQGATTIWESMQAIMPDGTRQAVSFILPTFCSIGNWMTEGMGGIKPLAAGFKKTEIRPYMTDKLSFVDTVYDSIQGEIGCRWERNDDQRIIEVRIPANTTAEIFLPDAELSDVKENGMALENGNGISEIINEAEGVRVCAGSGNYSFSYCVR